MAESDRHDYSEWKGWSEDSFGTPDRADVDYFSREMRKIGRERPVSRILEVGFGDGRFLGFARDNSWDVTGVELLPELIDRARSAGFTAVQSDEIDTLPKASYDLVVAFDVFEHIPPEHSVAFLRSLADRLAPHGRMVLRFPNADSSVGNPFQNGDPTHVNAIGYLKLKYYAGETDLRVVDFRAPARRGFQSSVVHGVHAMTAGLVVRASASVRRALYYPDLKLVLSSGNVLAILEHGGPAQARPR